MWSGWLNKTFPSFFPLIYVCDACLETVEIIDKISFQYGSALKFKAEIKKIKAEVFYVA